MKAYYKKYILKFKRPSGTSRGVMLEKETWFLMLRDGGKWGIGECGILRGLSMDDVPGYEEKLKWVCRNFRMGADALWETLTEYPSLQFGVEQAFRSLRSKDPLLLFPSAFTEGKAPIPINGLVWMGDEAFMQEQIKQKLESGFKCIKLKIGALDFETELRLLHSIRRQYTEKEVQIRVDANGAFASEEALEKLNRLSAFGLHSIEQPIRQGNWEKMACLCEMSPIPIALDEELIGINTVTKKEELLQTIRPQYLILKPGLVGGFRGSEEWITLAQKHTVGWWVTSALESNIGLNAIAQWTYTLENQMYQGLGTGGLFTNNIEAPLQVGHGQLGYDPEINWNVEAIQQLCI